MENNNLPEYEKLKLDLVAEFDSSKTYLGQFVKETIRKTSFKVVGSNTKPTQIKKGDVFISVEGKKSRPSVVLKVLKDKTVIYSTLTSTDNVHCLVPFKNRFWGEGCTSKALNVCTEEYAIEHFAGVFDDNKVVNKAIKELKEFFNKNL